MRVAWDVSMLSVPPTGIGRYVRETLRATAAARPRWELLAVSVCGREESPRLAAHLGALPPNVRRAHRLLRPARVWRRALNELPLPTLEALAGSVDAFVDSEWLHPRQRRGARIAIVYDLVPLRHPQWVDEATRRLHVRTLDTLGRRADRIVCISEATADDVEAYLGVPSERLAIARPGVDPAFAGAVPAPPAALDGRPYVLALGTLEPRKNLGVLLEAFARIAVRHPDVVLAVAGARGPAAAEVEAAAARLGIGPRVRLTGYVEDAALPGLVAGARALAFPSLFEGFGMPIVEAMAAGVPVVASTAPSLDEACGGAALRADPAAPAAFADALDVLLGDEGAAIGLVAAGRVHAATLTWEACGAAFAEAIEVGVGARAAGRGR